MLFNSMQLYHIPSPLYFSFVFYSILHHTILFNFFLFFSFIIFILLFCFVLFCSFLFVKGSADGEAIDQQPRGQNSTQRTGCSRCIEVRIHSQAYFLYFMVKLFGKGHSGSLSLWLSLSFSASLFLQFLFILSVYFLSCVDFLLYKQPIVKRCPLCHFLVPALHLGIIRSVKRDLFLLLTCNRRLRYLHYSTVLYNRV